ncbi:MAG: FAD-dependent oxidoreductase [Luteitalea sp.]|nr:FAD-dependent oxidoreductase [Luteitalea sp.]
MPRIRYGVPYWRERIPRIRRRSYPRLRKEAEADVVIVGATLAGCLTAYLAARDGAQVILLEPDRVAAQGALGGCGWVSREPDLGFRALHAKHGLRATRVAFDAWKRAATDFASLVRRLRIKCDLVQQAAVWMAESDVEAKELEREVRARRNADIDAALVRGRRLEEEIGTEARAAFRLRQDGYLNMYAAALGILRAAEGLGVQIFEQTSVRRVRNRRHHSEIVTTGGPIRTQHLVVTTEAAEGPFRGLARHLDLQERYVAVTPPLGAGVVRACGRLHETLLVGIPRRLRVSWTPDRRLIVTGAEQRPVHRRRLPSVLEQRTGELMYNLLVRYPAILGTPAEYGWSERFTTARGRLPYIGPHRTYARHLFAFGLGHGGAPVAMLAARILARYVQGAPEKEDEIFAFHR